MSGNNKSEIIMNDEREHKGEAGIDGVMDNGLSTQSTSSNNAYEKAQFNQLKRSDSSGGDEVNIDVLLDIPVILSVEIGRTRQTIRNLLQLNQGSVVELDRLAGEPMDVLVNGTLIAHGEIVVVNEKFGIRLTDVISAAERVKKLK